MNGWPGYSPLERDITGGLAVRCSGFEQAAGSVGQGRESSQLCAGGQHSDQHGWQCGAGRLWSGRSDGAGRLLGE